MSIGLSYNREYTNLIQKMCGRHFDYVFLDQVKDKDVDGRNVDATTDSAYNKNKRNSSVQKVIIAAYMR